VKTDGRLLGAIFIGLADAGPNDQTTNHARTTMQPVKTLGAAGALILSALVGGTLIGSALATDEATDPETTAAATEYCDVFMDTLASELGATRDELVSAGKAAASAAVDAALEAGDITEERATAIRERIDAADGTGCAWFGHGFAAGALHGDGRGLLGGDVLETAATALGIESSALRDRLDTAGSLEALATEEGVSYDEVKASVLAAVQSDLDAAVADGLDQARADAVIERLTTWLDAGGELGGFGPGHFGPGRGFGPWSDRGSDDTDAEDSGA
jgi:hypothetical protein